MSIKNSELFPKLELNKKEYINKGIGNFIVFMKELESKIDSNKKDEYNSFLDYLNKKIKE